MQWEIINTDVNIPKCIFCREFTDQMARFIKPGTQTIWMCSNCARYVKEAMNEWKDLKSIDYIESAGSVYNSELIDSIIDKHEHKPHKHNYI